MSQPTNGHHTPPSTRQVEEVNNTTARPGPAVRTLGEGSPRQLSASSGKSFWGSLTFWVLLLVLFAGGVVFWLLQPATPAATTAPAPPPAAVSVAAALEKTVTLWDEFSGRVQAIDRVDIRPRVAGTIESVHFAEGQLVTKGDPLFTIDPSPFQADLAHAQALQAEAEARLGLARSALDRSNRLIANHSVAQSEVDQSQAEFLGAQANLQAAASAVQTAQLNLGYTQITSPIDGRVSRAEITAGNLVPAGATAPVLTTVVSVDPVYVAFEIDEQTALRYSAAGAVGNAGLEHIPVQMGLANDEGYPHIGHLQALDNQLDPNSGTLRVRAVFPNADHSLIPGLFAHIRTGGTEVPAAVLIQDRAISTDQDKKYVMVLNADNQAVYRNVTLGPNVEGLRLIRSGLKAGEKIVVSGLQKVRPNAKVVPTLVPMQPGADSAAPVGS